LLLWLLLLLSSKSPLSQNPRLDFVSPCSLNGVHRERQPQLSKSPLPQNTRDIDFAISLVRSTRCIERDNNNNTTYDQPTHSKENPPSHPIFFFFKGQGICIFPSLGNSRQDETREEEKGKEKGKATYLTYLAWASLALCSLFFLKKTEKWVGKKRGKRTISTVHLLFIRPTTKKKVSIRGEKRGWVKKEEKGRSQPSISVYLPNFLP